jgi:hypothetical protein
MEHLADSGGQRRLAMVNVTDGPDIHMGFIALKLGLRHFQMLLLVSGGFVVVGTNFEI